MKKIFLLLILIFLYSCESSQEPEIKLMGLPEASVEKKTEVYYYHNPMTPYYVLLTKGEEHTLDWDETTFVENGQLEFLFERRELIKEIDLIGEPGLITFTSGDYTKSFEMTGDWQRITLDMTDKVSSLTVETEGKLYECHLVACVEVDQESYELFQEKQLLREQFLNFTWSSSPTANISLAQTISLHDIEVLPVEYFRLEDNIGYPVMIRGQIKSIEEYELYRVTLDTFINDEPIVLWMESVDSSTSLFEGLGIYLGKNKTFEFYIAE